MNKINTKNFTSNNISPPNEQNQIAHRSRCLPWGAVEGPRILPSSLVAPWVPAHRAIENKLEECSEGMCYLGNLKILVELGGLYREGWAERVHVLPDAQVLAPLRTETDARWDWWSTGITALGTKWIRVECRHCCRAAGGWGRRTPCRPRRGSARQRTGPGTGKSGGRRGGGWGGSTVWLWPSTPYCTL
jgi:hypothetical protein